MTTLTSTLSRAVAGIDASLGCRVVAHAVRRAGVLLPVFWLVTTGGCSRVDHLEKAITLQRQVLTAETKKARERGIDELIHHVDRLDRQQLREVRESLAVEIQRAGREWIDRYYSAPEADRPALLDADIDRLLGIRELWLAITPGATEWSPRLSRARGRKPAADTPPAADSDRKLRELYTAALLARAKTRGVSLPELQ